MYRKRERTQNWSLEEKMYLLQLVKSRLDVLENKRIDSASSAMKGMAWQDIHAAFAARFGNDRDAHRVREQWRRMKGQARTEMMEFAERVRNYGAEVANQRWPSTLSEDVWKTLETARKVEDYQQGHGMGDDAGSPITMDDDEEDADDMVDYADIRGHDRFPDRAAVKAEPVDEGVQQDQMDRLGHHDPAMDETAGLMSMLRPKVELNDVPDLDTSMVPSGLSITAVNLAGGANKRRLLDRHVEPPYRNNHAAWDGPAPALPAPPAPQQHRGDVHGLPAAYAAGAHGAPSRSTALGRSGTPQQLTSQPSAVEGRSRLESRRRLEMLEEEHAAKMALLRVEKETAEIRRRIALREEEVTDSALPCRTCEQVGGGRADERQPQERGRGSPPPHHRHTVAKCEAGDDPRPDLDNDADASVPSSVATVVPRSPSEDERSTDNSCGDQLEPGRHHGINGSADSDLE